MWTHLRDWKVLTGEWIDGQFNNIKIEVIRSKANQFSKAKKKLNSKPVLDELTELVHNFKETMPVVSALGKKKLLSHHLKQIKEIIGQDFDRDDPKLTLRSLLEMNVISK